MPIFRYYTDATGNNHALVRQILKRRAWLQRIDTMKKHDSTSFFWTQYHNSKIYMLLKPNQIYAKLRTNYLVTNKANLLKTMTEYYNMPENKQRPRYLPLSFTLKTNKAMGNYSEF